MSTTKKTRLSLQTLFIGSGKGGVGKSTVATNLAVALAQEGLSVGLLDADLYGPSIPIMLGLRRLPPKQENNASKAFIPICKFGIRIMSIGFFIEESQSLLWRGPLLQSSLSRLIHGVSWGDLDMLLIDLPPGTGDVLLGLAQILNVDGAIAVTTPQEVAMLDAIKAINAFDQLDIPLLGIVENMAGFTPPGSKETYPIFGKGKGEELAKRFNSQVLGSIPLNPEIGRCGDEGSPFAFEFPHTPFHQLAKKTLELCQTEKSNPFI